MEFAFDVLLAGETTEEIVGLDGALKQVTKALIQQAMNAEIWVMRSTRQKVEGPAKTATAAAPKRWRATSVR